MTDQKLFRLTQTGDATTIKGSSEPLEKPLQRLIEKNLYTLLGVHFLASEYNTGKQHGGRMDSLGIDENGCPVILEYKAKKDENVINQGLYYLGWLVDHHGDFRVLVEQRIKEGKLPGSFKDIGIDFKSVRVICVAGDFNKFDVHAVRHISQNIELIRYVRFGEDLFFLELLNGDELSQPNQHPVAIQVSATEGADTAEVTVDVQPSRKAKTVTQYLEAAPEDLKALFNTVREHLLLMGDDVQEKVNLDYIAFRRLKNFACVEVHSQPKRLLVFLKVDPTTITIEKDFSRDVRQIGHFGTGDLELSIRTLEDFEKAKPFIQQSFEAS